MARADPGSGFGDPVTVTSGDVELAANLRASPDDLGVVAFAHGSGSDRLSPRNRFVAENLWDAGLGTLLVDLLTDREKAIDAETRRYRFDIGLLARRLVGAIDWLRRQEGLREAAVGVFGSSTGAAAALIAAAERPDVVRAVVSRGGRTDLAGGALARVRAPTLMIVGGQDAPVMQMNRESLALVSAPGRLEVIAGAGHLFEGPGELEQVAVLARAWFAEYLGGARTVAGA